MSTIYILDDFVNTNERRPVISKNDKASVSSYSFKGSWLLLVTFYSTTTRFLYESKDKVFN